MKKSNRNRYAMKNLETYSLGAVSGLVYCWNEYLSRKYQPPPQP